MSLSCFFGTELRVSEEPQCPLIPAQSSLVVTQACITSDSYRAWLSASGSTDGGQQKPKKGETAGTRSMSGGLAKLVLMAQGLSTKQPIAVCTLSPKENIFHHKLNLIFSKYCAFSLVCVDAKTNQKMEHCPLQVHLTGYYECDEGHNEDEEDEEDEEEDDELVDMDFDEEAMYGSKKKKGGKGQPHQMMRGADSRGNRKRGRQ